MTVMKAVQSCLVNNVYQNKKINKQCFDLRFYQIQFRKIKSMVKNIYKNKQQKEELKCMKRIHSNENVT